MKKVLYILLAGWMLSAAVSCEKFLTEASKSSLTPENSFVTPEDWDKALTAAYGMLQNTFIGNYTITINNFGTDEVEPFDLGWAAYAQLKYYTFSAQHEFFQNHYECCYDAVKRTNTVLDMPESAPVSAERRTQMMAEAKFLRALFYFELVSNYGGVPVWTSSIVDRTQINKPKMSADEVYRQIVSDMTDAAEALPEKWPSASDVGRATKGAAYALLGRFLLQWGKPQEALDALNKVTGYRLYDTYAEIFDKNNKNQGVENIFEVQSRYSGKWGLEGSIQSSYWGPRGGGGPTAGGFGWGGFGPTRYLYDSYEDGDLRKTAFFCTEYKGVPQDPPCIMKYRDPDHNNEIEDDDLNYILIRYADVLLMKAEALNATGDATTEKYDCLNQVRRRAGLADITSADGLSKEQFAAAVLEERLHELCCERHRRTDLVRFGKLAEQVRAAFPEITLDAHFNLYPIPQSAIDANDAMTEEDQNPGY